MKSHTLIALALTLASCVGASPGREVRYMNLDESSELPFSHAVLAGDTLYVAGSLGLDPDTGAPPASAEDEARLCLDSIRAKLELAEMTMDDLVQVQVFCPDLSLYDTFNTVYRTYFDEHFPARAFIGSGPLLRGARFEVNAIGVRQR